MTCAMSGCNIGCKKKISERGKLPLKLTGPTGTSTCFATLLNIGGIGLCPKHSAYPITVFDEFTGKGCVVMLHAECAIMNWFH